MKWISPTATSILAEVLLRIVAGVVSSVLNTKIPFVREVQTSQWYKYNFPFAVTSRVSNRALVILVTVGLCGGLVVTGAVLFACRHVFRRPEPPPVAPAAAVPSAAPAGAFSSDKLSSARSVHSAHSLRQPAASDPAIAWSTYVRARSIAGLPMRATTFKTIFAAELLRMAFSLSFSILVASIVTAFIKNLYGRPRPDFLDRCRPSGFDRLNPDFDALGLIPVCSASGFDVTDGRRSFPSGHSSLAFATYGWLAIYLYYQLLPLAAVGFRAALYSVLLRANFHFWGCFTLLAVPGYTALSRTMDYRHHWEDVLAGSAIGAAAAIVAYRHYYRPHLFFAHPAAAFADVPDREELVSELSALPVKDLVDLRQASAAAAGAVVIDVGADAAGGAARAAPYATASDTPDPDPSERSALNAGTRKGAGEGAGAANSAVWRGRGHAEARGAEACGCASCSSDLRRVTSQTSLLCRSLSGKGLTR